MRGPSALFSGHVRYHRFQTLRELSTLFLELQRLASLTFFLLLVTVLGGLCVCELEGRREKGTYDDLRGDFGVLGASRDGLDEAMDGESIRHES